MSFQHQVSLLLLLLVVVLANCCTDELVDDEAQRCLKGVTNNHLPNTRYNINCQVYMAYQCDGKALRLHCPQDGHVKILNVFYGRYDDEVCPFANVATPGYEECGDITSNLKVKQRLESVCGDVAECNFTVNPLTEHDVHIWFANGEKDPCGKDVPKYLVVAFVCRPPAALTTSANVPVTNSSHSTSSLVHATAATSDAVFTKKLESSSTTLTELATSPVPTPETPTQQFTTETETETQTSSQQLQCASVDRLGFNWPPTSVRTVVYKQCANMNVAETTNMLTGSVSWLCTADGSWHSDGPDTTGCRNTVIEQLAANITNDTDWVDLTRDTAALTASITLQPGDLSIVIDVLSASANSQSQSAQSDQNATASEASELLGNLVQTTSNLFETKQRSAWNMQPNRTELIRRVIDTIETVAFSHAAQKQSTDTTESKLDTSNVKLEMLIMTRSDAASSDNAQYDQKKPAFDDYAKSTPNYVGFKAQLNVSAYLAKYLPSNNATKLAVLFARYSNMADFVTDLQPSTNDNITTKPVRGLSGHLISDIFTTSAQPLDSHEFQSGSASGPMRTYDSTDRLPIVHFTLPHASPNSSGKRVCSFWYSAVHNEPATGYWSDVGCWRVNDDDDNETVTHCACSHLTNFAILLDTSGVLRSEALTEANELALTLLTLIGCGMSCISALLAFVLFSITKVYKGRFPERNTIHKNVCINLCMAQLCLLVNIVGYSAFDTATCITIGVLQHFFFLVTFSWISLEGVQLFIMLVIVFETKYSLKPVFYAIGYGIPALIVIVSVAVHRNGYVNNKMCWLTPDNGFIWAFAGPVALVLFINYVVFTVAWITIASHSARRARSSDSNRPCIGDEQDAAARASSSASSQQRGVHSGSSSGSQTTAAIRSWLKGASVLCVLLGLTWIFGFLLWMTPGASIAFAYVFTALNSAQGLFILVLHFLIDAKVRAEAWNKVQRYSVVRRVVRAASRSRRSSTLRPPSANCVAAAQPRRSSISRLSALLKRSSTTHSTSSAPSSFNTLLSLFGHRIALRRNRKTVRPNTNDVTGTEPDTFERCVSDAPKEKLVLGESLVCAKEHHKTSNDTSYLRRFLAEQEDSSIGLSTSHEPCSSFSNSHVPSSMSQPNSATSPRSSSIAPFSKQCPPSYALATECSSGTVHSDDVTSRGAALSLTESDSAYGTQCDKAVRFEHKRDADLDFDSHYDSEALSSYCDSRILTEFTERVVIADDRKGDSHRQHNHKCHCEHEHIQDSSEPKQIDTLLSSDSLKEQSSDDCDVKKRTVNYEKTSHARLSELLNAVGEKDFESELSESELFK